MLVRHAGGLTIVAKQLQTCFDMNIARVKVCCALIGVQSICGLIVAGLILANSQVILNA